MRKSPRTLARRPSRVDRRRFSGPRAFSAILREMRGKEPWGGRLARNFAFRAWPKAVGGGVSRVARPVFLKNDCLHVEVGDSIWLYELELRKQDLIARVNEHLEDSRIREIRFRLSNGGLGFDEDDEKDESAGLLRKATPISSGDDAAIAGAIAGMEDAQLRRAAEKLIRHVRAQERSGE